MIRRILGSDDPVDFVFVVAFFVLYLVVDRATGLLSELGPPDVSDWSLVAAAVERRDLWWAGLAVIVGIALFASGALRERALAPWSALDHGAALRLLAAPLLVVLAWSGTLYPYNSWAGQLHLLDRGLVAILALAVLWRPLFLIPFALQFRIVAAQTVIPFGTRSAENIGEVPVIVLLLIGTGHLLFVLTGRRATSAVLLAVGAALAAHFYIPGKGKLLMGWLGENDIANLAMSAYTAGWLGDTDGSVAATTASLFDRYAPVVMVATLVLEVGSLVAAAHRRLLRPWLIGWIAFHVVTFVTTGFFFISWILAEVGLLIILSRRELRAWVDENATWARAAVAVAAVAGAPVLFHPPGLAWFDAPVSYGYRLEVTGVSGATYSLPASALAPLDQEVMFKRLQFDGPGHLSGPYGALESAERLDELENVESLSDLQALEAEQPPTDPALRATTIDLLTRFMRASHDDDVLTTTRWLHRLNTPPLYWSSSPADRYRFTEPIVELDVTLITSVHTASNREAGTVLRRTDPLVTLTFGSDGMIREQRP